MKNRIAQSDNWETPKYFYDELDAEFNFDFDPCPLCFDEFIPPERDGLLIEWGGSNFVNPPYSRKLKEAFIRKGLEESRKGKLVVFLIPVSTSTIIFHDVIKPYADEIRFIRGRIPFVGTRYDKKNDVLKYVNWHLTDREAPEGVEHEKNSGQFDSMVVVFDGRVE